MIKIISTEESYTAAVWQLISGSRRVGGLKDQNTISNKTQQQNYFQCLNLSLRPCHLCINYNIIVKIKKILMTL